MSWQSIIGQPHAVAMLRNSVRRGIVSHAYILNGPLGTGKAQTARQFAKAILCESPIDGDACDHCISCRKLESGNHTGLTIVEPQDSPSIKIEQIRELQRKFVYKSADAGSQVYMILQAERMTEQASNALLKFLEEPGTKLTAILVTHNGHALLPTIRSRAQWVNFQPVSQPQVEAALISDGIEPAIARTVSHLSSGIEQARQLAAQNGFAETRNLVLQLAKEANGRLSNALLTVQQKLSKSESQDQLKLMMDLFVLWFKDMVQVQWNRTERLVFNDQLESLRVQAQTRTPKAWVDAMRNALEVQKRLISNANPQLVLEQFIVSLERR